MCVKSIEETVSISGEVTANGEFEQITSTQVEVQSFRKLTNPRPKKEQHLVSFHNESPYDVELYWDDGKDGVLQGVIKQGKTQPVGTYFGHKFFYKFISNETDIDNKNRLLAMDKILMQFEKTHYSLKDYETYNNDKIEFEREKMLFTQKYYKETGLIWKAFYPRPKPTLYMFPCENIHDTYPVTSNYTYYHCYPQLSNNYIYNCNYIQYI